MSDAAERKPRLAWALVAVAVVLSAGALTYRIARRAPTGETTQKSEDDCEKVEKACPIDTGAFQAPVVEVPPPAPAPAASAAPTAAAPSDSESARRKLEQVLASPGFQQVLARQVHTQLEEIDGAVHLDPTQKTKLGELLSRQAQAGVAMGAAVLGAGDAAAGKDDVFAIQREIDALLTPAQRKDYDAWKRARSEQARERQRDADERKLVDSLGLDPAQRDEVAKLVSESRFQPSPHLSDADRESLAQSKLGSREREAALERLLSQEVEDPELTAKLTSVLRPEQMDRYRQYLEAKRKQRDQLRTMFTAPRPPSTASNGAPPVAPPVAPQPLPSSPHE